MQNYFKRLTGYFSIIILVQSCISPQKNDVKLPVFTEAIPVKVIPVKRLTSVATVNSFGHLTTDNETELGFITGGVVKSVNVKEGDQVKEGQLLATLDVTNNNFEEEQLKHSYDKAERDLNRLKILFNDSAATLEQLQNAETTFRIFSAQLNAQKFNRNYYEIRARSKGYVISRYVNEGQVVSGGEKVLLTNGTSHEKWLLKASVNDINWVAIGVKDTAKIKVDAFPGRVFNATVYSKSESADPATGTFTIKLLVDNGGARFASGMFASAQIFCHTQHSFWNLPYGAVLDAGNGKGYVFVTNNDQSVSKQIISIESFDAGGIRVTSGLEDAKAVVISGSAYLTDKSAVKILN